MAAREAEYQDLLPLNVFVGTWNVNGGKHYRSVALRVRNTIVTFPDLFAPTPFFPPILLIYFLCRVPPWPIG